MTHDELKTAINKMNLAKIKTFSASRIKDLTDDFKDDLLIDIAKKARTDKEALEVIDWLKQKYEYIYEKRKSLPMILREMRKRVEFELPLTPDNTQLNEENHSLNEENRSLNTENAELNEENRSLNTENAKLNEENRSLNTENAKLNEENAKLNKENAKLNEENRSLNTENAKLLQQLKAFQSQLQGIAELEAEKASLEKLLEEEKLKNQGIDDLPELDEVQKMTLHKKIVFFTTVTSVLLDKRYTNMRNLASFIASMCNEKPSTIGPMLSRIGQISDDNPNPKLSATLHSAAQCVSDLLLQILTDETRHDKSQIINKISENLLLNYPLPEDE